MKAHPDASRFTRWLRASTTDECTPLPTTLDSLETLIADAMAFADDRAERAGGAASPVACRAGCHWCCYLPGQATVAEALIAVDFALRHYSDTHLEGLRQRAREVATRYPGYAKERPGASDSVPCPFLQGRKCGIYPARPLTCRGWSSFDAEACESAYRQGPDSVAVPVNQRLRMVHAATGDALARAFLRGDLQGHVYLGQVLHPLLAVEDLDGFTASWLSGTVQL